MTLLQLCVCERECVCVCVCRFCVPRITSQNYPGFMVRGDKMRLISVVLVNLSL